jgi:hypothetical protein
MAKTERKQNIKQNNIGHYGVRVTQSVVFFVVFCITLFVLVGFGRKTGMRGEDHRPVASLILYIYKII